MMPADMERAALILSKAQVTSREERESAILVAAFPSRMRRPMPEDLKCLLEVLRGE